jgi:SAM-dependent methyltransferase
MSDENPWLKETVKGADYDARWQELARSGKDVHGEAGFVERLGGHRVLDAGCGTGRVAIELAARGFDVVGVDLDDRMLAEARTKAPDLTWVTADLASLDLGRTFDTIVAAGNVMIFVTPGSEATVVERLARHLDEGGRLVSGFQLGRSLDLDRYDTHCADAGLHLESRYATWDGDPFAGGDYAVSVHRA